MFEKLADIKDLREWLQTYASDKKLSYLLAFADDGVIWGWFDGKQLATAPETWAQLRIQTIQRIHIFGQAGELRIFRTRDGFETTWLEDAGWEPSNWINERYLLWGEGEYSKDNFTLMVEGLQGLRHMPPVPDGQGKSAYIDVRHYIRYDIQGQAYISHSRLLGVDTLSGENL
jgi:CRISPR-associated protein (TIGR03984 family)